MPCANCGKNAPTKKVKFLSNVGLIFFRLDFAEEGQFCKSCMHVSFVKNQLICLVFGWWGIISFFVNFTYIALNFIEWVFSLGMKSNKATRKKVKPANVKPAKIKPAKVKPAKAQPTNAEPINVTPTNAKQTNATPKKAIKSNSSHDQQLRQLATQIRRKLRGGEKAAKVSADVASATGIPQQDVFQFIKKHYKQLTAPSR